MSAVLGVSGLYHDAAAALVVDGEVIAAVQEERLSRIKNDPSLPRRAMRFCLEEGARRAGIRAGDLARVVYYEDPFAKLDRVVSTTLRAFPRGARVFGRALAAQLGEKLWVLDALADDLVIERRRVHFVDHHRAHAASAFFASGYDDAAVVTVDGVGEWVTTALWHGSGRDLRCLATLHHPHSLGLFFAGVTAYLGFRVNEDELKVMSLAALGAPRRVDDLSRVLRLAGDGSFELEPSYFRSLLDDRLAFGASLERLLGPRRAPGRPWDPQGADVAYAEVAASAQRLVEDAVLGLARRALQLSGADHLCMAGGVALNAVANARVRRECGATAVYVHPAAGDAGGALGAAYLGALDEGDRPAPLAHAAVGPMLDGDRAESLAHALGLEVTRLSPHTLASEVARRLAAHQLVAFARGRCEWGPRALGQRSILGAATEPSGRERLNRVIKRRETFLPFAPSVLADEAHRWFPEAPCDMSPFMTTVSSMTDAARTSLAAVGHADGSARVHTVTGARAPELADVLSALPAVGLPPILLNTSLNGRGEPICSSAEDAVGFFVTHRVDALVAGDRLITRPG